MGPPGAHRTMESVEPRLELRQPEKTKSARRYEETEPRASERVTRHTSHDAPLQKDEKRGYEVRGARGFFQEQVDAYDSLHYRDDGRSFMSERLDRMIEAIA